MNPSPQQRRVAGEAPQPLPEHLPALRPVRLQAGLGPAAEVRRLLLRFALVIAEEAVDGYAEHAGDGRQQGDVGGGEAVLPLAHRLGRHPQQLCQPLLGHLLLPAQGADVLSYVIHGMVLLAVLVPTRTA